MSLADRIPVPLVFVLLLIVGPMMYLFLQAEQARQQGLTEIAGTFSAAANIFLLFTLASFVILLLIRQGAFGNDIYDSLSKNSSEEIGAGIAIGLSYIFLVGFTGGAQSIFQLPVQSIFAQAGEALSSHFWQIQIVGLAAPLAEELFFGLAVPTILFFIFKRLTEDFRLPAGTIINVVVTILITGFLFAFFHIGNQANPQFVFSSIVFRTLILSLIMGDWLTNIIPFFNIGIGTAWGIHLGTNLGLITTVQDFIYTMLFVGDGTIPTLIFGVLTILFFVTSFGYLFKKIGVKLPLMGGG